MLDLFIIVGLGKAFYDLAGEFKKNQWLYAIIGIVFFYLLTFLSTIIITILLVPNVFTDNNSLTSISYGAIIISLICCLIFYAILKKRWATAPKKTDGKLLDDHFNIGK